MVMDGHEAAMKTDANENVNPEKNVNNVPENKVIAEGTLQQSFANDSEHVKDGGQQEAHQHSDLSGEVNMEAAISPDDIIRAGGFGARDSLSSVFPLASDSTDFASSLLDMRDYEDPQGERHRPGLGWSKDNVRVI